ncbi:DUF1491 family protein [bacterium]|nr:DUF1491 family protein [bacterium]
MSRLTTEIWVAAYLTRLRLATIPAYIIQKGDGTAGAVLVKLNKLDGSASCFQRSFDLMTDERKWVVHAQGTEAEVDSSIAKQRSFDPDLWVIEIEDKTGKHLLDEPGLA